MTEVSIAQPLSTLENLSDRDLRGMHDALANRTGGFAITVTYYLEELARRRADRQARTLKWLTVFIAILTAANVALVAVDVL
jgi:hypothetical protein